MVEKVNWAEVPGVGAGDKVGGPRHGEETIRTPQPQAWKCPACGQQQVGVIEHGCTACGAGAPGRFVGVDPVVRKGTTDGVRVDPLRDLGDGRLRHPQSAAPAAPSTTADPDQAFIEWFRPMRGQYAPEVETLLHEAFRAGFFASQVRRQTEAEQPLTGTPESRTIVAALRFWRENALPNMREEISTGEVLGPDEVDELIARLERTQ